MSYNVYEMIKHIQIALFQCKLIVFIIIHDHITNYFHYT